MFCRRTGWIAVLAATVALRLQAEPRIQHAGLECIEPGKFAVVLSGIDPGGEIQSAKVYFRSSLYPDFYYVEMVRDEGRFVGVLPQVSPETKQVIYYVEALDTIFESGRSLEFDPTVEDPCDDDPAAAYLPGDPPTIIVGATTAGASPLPPGFSAIGIAGTITAAGIASGIGGGLGVGTAVGVAAGAAGAAGAVVAASSGTEAPPTTTIAAPPTTAVTTSVPTATSSAPATSTTTSIAPTSTTTSAVSSTTTSVIDTTTTTISSTSTTSAVSTTTTSVASTTTTAPTLDASCFTVTVVRECRVRLDATCVRLPVDRYEWILDVDDEWKTEYIRDGSASFTHHFSDCDDDSEVITFQLTVHRGGSSDTATKSIRVPGDDLKVAPANPAMQFQSHLALPPLDGSSRARVLLNGSLARVVESSHPVEVRADAGSGSNRIEAFVVRATGASGHFRFDFSTERLRRGSLRVEHGSLLAMESNAIVFRLSGQAGEHVSFTFELDR